MFGPNFQNQMKIKSYCKINLSLRVLRKLNNNLHDIESNNVMVNVFDEIKKNWSKQIKPKISLALKENLENSLIPKEHCG